MNQTEQDARNPLPLDRLADYLGQHWPELSGTPAVTQYAGGASNWTYRLDYPKRGTALILRRAPAGTKAKGAHDMAREYRILKALKPVYSTVPDVYALCEDSEVIGSPFFVMEHLDGWILRRDPPPGLNVDPELAQRLCHSMIDNLAALHAVPVDRRFQDINKGPGYARRQIDGWCYRYQKAWTEDAAGFEAVMSWLQDRIPDDVGQCLIHNDYRFDNLVLQRNRPDRIIGVLDWELATVGDPLMELGATLAYWAQADDDPPFLQFRRQPTHLPGMLSRDQLSARYLAQTGLGAADFVFYEVYGLFRLAGIAQQIYYRYHHGQTRNPAFAAFGPAVNYLEQRCLGIIA